MAYKRNRKPSEKFIFFQIVWNASDTLFDFHDYVELNKEFLEHLWMSEEEKFMLASSRAEGMAING